MCKADMLRKKGSTSKLLPFPVFWPEVFQKLPYPSFFPSSFSQCSFKIIIYGCSASPFLKKMYYFSIKDTCQNVRPRRVDEFLKDIKRRGSLRCELFCGLETSLID